VPFYTIQKGNRLTERSSDVSENTVEVSAFVQLGLGLDQRVSFQSLPLSSDKITLLLSEKFLGRQVFLNFTGLKCGNNPILLSL
jgi:hypothetical protein